LHFDKNYDFFIFVELSIEASCDPTSHPRDPDLGNEMSMGTTAVQNARAGVLYLP